MAVAGSTLSERKQLTVMFTNVSDFTAMPESPEPIVDRLFELMMDAVHHFEGAVINLMGDGLMALFGAPLVHEDHAVLACYAALQMQEEVKRYAEHVRLTHRTNARIGINTGLVVVGVLGPDLRMDYRAVGDPVTVASHLMEAAEPGTILIGETTYGVVRGIARVESVEPLRIEGRSKPIVAYRLLGADATNL